MMVSYEIHLVGEYRCFWEMIEAHRASVKMLIGIVSREWDNYPDLSGHFLASVLEKLIHSANGRKAKYRYDEKFPKYPVYLRRSDLNEAIGAVQSYKNGVKYWQEHGCVGAKPSLQLNRNSMPFLYKNGMYKLEKQGEDYVCRIKMLKNGKWKLIPVVMRKTDVDYIKKNFSMDKWMCPLLKKHVRKYSIAVTFETDSVLPEKDEKILACDLGLNTAAVCCIMDKRGNILKRKFIDFPVEKARMKRVRNEVRRAHSDAPCHSNKLNRWARNYNESISIKTVHAVVEFALENGVDTIVTEWISPSFGKLKGYKKQDIALWRKRELLDRMEQLSLRNGIKMRMVSGYLSSMLAFDGSGMVKRDFMNYSQCTFQTGKRYNADLNAAYNIGARYCIREIRDKIKTFYSNDTEKVRENVPMLKVESRATLSTLYELVEFMDMHPEIRAVKVVEKKERKKKATASA